MNIIPRRLSITAALLLLVLLSACGGNGNERPPNPIDPNDPNSRPLPLTGQIHNGSASGGSIFVYSADDIQSVLQTADAAADRAVSLKSATPIASLMREPGSGAAYAMEIPAAQANQALFIVFDSGAAEDGSIGDAVFNMESVVVAGRPGGDPLRANINPHTTMISRQTRNALDPDGDGVVIDTAAIEAEILLNINAVREAVGTDENGLLLFPLDNRGNLTNPLTLEASDTLATASIHLATLIRTIIIVSDISESKTFELLSADASDGRIDGATTALYSLDAADTDNLSRIADVNALGAARTGDLATVSCSSSTAAARRACDYTVLERFFNGAATCAQNPDPALIDECEAQLVAQRTQNINACAAITTARANLCNVFDDAIHEPPFGEGLGTNYVNPIIIGAGVAANPFLPLVQGNRWVYEGSVTEGGRQFTQQVTVSVTNKRKSITGINCLVVNKVTTRNGTVIEDTNDWLAQDNDGNVWHCGAEIKDFQTFAGDQPPTLELVALERSFKTGRDRAEAGILMPANLVQGTFHRQELAKNIAEGAMEILSLNGNASAPARNCNNNCLLTRDFSTLQPGVEKNTYYLAGVGKLVEENLQTGDRLELIEFTQSM